MPEYVDPKQARRWTPAIIVVFAVIWLLGVVVILNLPPAYAVPFALLWVVLIVWFVAAYRHQHRRV